MVARGNLRTWLPRAPIARQAHNLKVGGSNPPPATSFIPRTIKHLARLPAGFSFAERVAIPTAETRGFPDVDNHCRGFRATSMQQNCSSMFEICSTRIQAFRLSPRNRTAAGSNQGPATTFICSSPLLGFPGWCEQITGPPPALSQSSNLVSTAREFRFYSEARTHIYRTSPKWQKRRLGHQAACQHNRCCSWISGVAADVGLKPVTGHSAQLTDATSLRTTAG